jgi:hypothetical protein
MPLDLLFVIANLVALAGWTALLLAPPGPHRLVGFARIAGVLLALAYLLLFIVNARAAGVLAGDYSLDGIGAFFAVPELRLVGWVHYLAFDLWVGSWEVEEAGRSGMRRAALIPCLILTFLVGPIGLLLFLGLRRAQGRRTAS